MAQITPIRSSRLSEAEQRFIEVYSETGDTQEACIAAGFPVANADSILARPHVRRVLDAAEGFQSATEMDQSGLMNEVLQMARRAVSKESFGPAAAAYRLVFDMKEKVGTGATYDVDKVESELKQLVAKGQSR